MATERWKLFWNRKWKLLHSRPLNHFLRYRATCSILVEITAVYGLSTLSPFPNVTLCHSETLQTLTVLGGGMWGAGHMIRVVSPIIFWFPQMCHLSVRLQSSAGRAIRPDCGRQKGIRHRRFAAVSRSLWCHGADVSEAWFSSLQPEQDRQYQGRLIIYSNIQVGSTQAENTCQDFWESGKIINSNISFQHTLLSAACFLFFCSFLGCVALVNLWLLASKSFSFHILQLEKQINSAAGIVWFLGLWRSDSVTLLCSVAKWTSADGPRTSTIWSEWNKWLKVLLRDFYEKLIIHSDISYLLKKIIHSFILLASCTRTQTPPLFCQQLQETKHRANKGKDEATSHD